MSDAEIGDVVQVPRGEWEALKDRLARLEQSVGVGARPAAGSVVGGLTDRRGLLKRGAVLAAGAVAGGTALVAVQAAPAAAATGTMLYGASNNSGTSATDLTGGSSQYLLALHGTDTSGNGAVVRIDDNNGSSGGTGVLFDGLDVVLSCRGDAVNVSNDGTGGGVNSSVGSAGSGTAVSGFSFNGVGVYGSSTHGVAVQADISLSFGGAPAMQSSTAGHAGEAFAGTISNATNPSNGIDITTAGTGSALYGLITNQSSSAPAALVTTEGTGYGLWAQQLGGDVAAVYGDCSISGGPGVQGVSGNTGVAGVLGTGAAGPGVEGDSSNTYPGVLGSSTGPGHGVEGQITSPTSNSAAVYGATNGTGQAVLGQITNAASAAAAVGGVTNGTGPGFGGLNIGTGPAISGQNWGAGPAIIAGVVGVSNSQPALSATTAGTGAAVQGTATGTGSRGGVFAGVAAQLQLSPGAGSTHPTSGQAGDLYTDKTLRLWFCTIGGTTATWKQIQLA